MVAGRIRQEDIEAVRERTDLVKLVGGYLTLKRSGHDSFVGLCPFHAEKTPSFSISPSKGVYYCFGCGAGGDAVRFLRDVDQLSFVEAVERLASEAGVRLRYEGESPAQRRAASRRQALTGANEEAARLFHRMLSDGREAQAARAYVQEREIAPASVQEFGIGYAPMYADFLLRRLARRFSPEILIEAGLAVKDAGGGVRDRFRGRVTFPVHDLSGRAVGFGARALTDDRQEGPKYLNSPETPIYRKNELLYNLHRAKGAVTKSGQAVVVEGYTDVVALRQAGVEAAVATCGTALGEGHFRLLSRFAQRVVLAFDSDEAGARGAERAYGFHERFPAQPVVLILPEGLDPADFVGRHGSDAFSELVADAEPLVEFMIRRAVLRHDLRSVEGQTAAVSAAMPIVEGLQDPVRQREYAHLLAELADVSEASVLLTLERKLAGRPVETAPAVRRISAQERLEREMLKLLARDADIFTEYVGRLEGDHFQTAQYATLFDLLVDAKGDVTVIIADADDEKTTRLLSALTLEPLDGDLSLQYANGVWVGLHSFLLKRRSSAIRQRLQKMNPTTDARYDELFQELVAMDGELRRLREQGGSAI